MFDFGQTFRGLVCDCVVVGECDRIYAENLLELAGQSGGSANRS